MGQGGIVAQDQMIDSLRIQLSKTNGEEKIKTLIGLSYHNLRISTDTSLHYAQSAFEYSQATQNERGIARALLMIGNAYNVEGKNSLAIKNHKEALQIFNALQDTLAMGITHNNLGIDFHDLGQYQQAIDHYKAAINIAEKRSDTYSICNATNNIGVIYEDWDKPELALEFYGKALQLARDMNDHSYIGIALQNIGVANSKTGNFTKALDYFDQSLELSQQINDNKGICNTLLNKADVFIKLNDTTSAIESLQNALQLSGQTGNLLNEANASLKLGLIFLQKNELIQAEKQLKSTLSIARKLEDVNLEQEAYNALADYYRQSGDFERALKYYSDFTRLKDSVFNRDSRKELSEMETLYELDKKENEIEIQNLRIERQQAQFYYIFSGIVLLIILAYLIFNRYKLKQKQARSELERKNIEIEQRLLRTQMNPHFIFNSLNSINSFISDRKTENAQAFLSKFARLMRYILENSRKTFVPVEDEVNTLRLNLELEQLRFDHRFNFEIDVDDKIDMEFTYIPPMLIQPFVENAILHGVSRMVKGGEINISIQQSGELMHCKISDNGIGREKAMERKQQTGPAKHRSMGMDVTRERLEILNEKTHEKVHFSITDLKDKSGNPTGTRVDLFIPFESE